MPTPSPNGAGQPFPHRCRRDAPAPSLVWSVTARREKGGERGRGGEEEETEEEEEEEEKEKKDEDETNEEEEEKRTVSKRHALSRPVIFFFSKASGRVCACVTIV